MNCEFCGSEQTEQTSVHYPGGKAVHGGGYAHIDIKCLDCSKRYTISGWVQEDGSLTDVTFLSELPDGWD